MEPDDSEIIKALARAGAKGLTKADLKKSLSADRAKKIDSLLAQLRASGLIRGPFQIGRPKLYFDAKSAPTREQTEARIVELLRQAWTNLTSRSSLEKKIKRVPKMLFNDALSLLKAEGKIVELRGPRRAALYVHSEPILEQLQLAREVDAQTQRPSPTPSLSSSPKPAISLDEVRPIYEALKAQQGGISAVKIYDVLRALECSKEELHRLLLSEARRGRVSLHPASTVNFPAEVIVAGIRLEGEPHPFITVVVKGGS
jgi:hypothetical protein